MQNISIKTALAAVFVCLGTALYAQSIDLNPQFSQSNLRYTQDNYYAPPADAPVQESAPSAQGEADQTGPWMICEIKTQGLRNIKPRTITKNISAKEGRMYYRSAWQDDAAAIMALGNFDSVDIELDSMPGVKKNKEDKEDLDSHQCHRLTFIVEERPILEKIIYRGRKALSKSAITGAMSLKIKDPFSEAKLQSDMERIKAAYAEKGYLNPQISFTFEVDDKKNIVIVTLIIDEGQRTRVGEVSVEGLEAIPQKTFIKKLANRPGKVYKPQKTPQDHYKATMYARNLGYYDFKILDYKTELGEDKTLIDLLYQVHEGKKAKFGNVAFEGNRVFTDKELADLVFYKKGQKYKQQKFDITMRDMQEKYADKGYLRAEIEPKRELDEDGFLNIEYTIAENNIVFIDHIDITGNVSTRTHVFARELVIREGDVFNYSKVKRGQARIMNMGFINDVQIDVSPTNDINKVDVGYHITEGRPGMFTAGVAMSSLDGLYGDVSVNHMNLFGRAQRLSLRALFGSRILDYTVSWSTPWIFDKPMSFGVDAFSTRRFRSYQGMSSAYTEKTIGGRLRLGPRFNDDIYNLSFSYSFEHVNIGDIDHRFRPGQPGFDPGLVEGDLNVSTFGTGFAIDTRDNYWDPTTGARNSLGLDVAGGPFMGDLDTYQVNFKSSYNYTLLNIGKDYPIVLMIANRLGMVKSYGRTDVVPVWQRVFLGGADTVRGYDNTGQIGPDRGGEVYYVGNVELKFPLAREGRRTIAQLAAFFDIGNSWKDWDDVRFSAGRETDEFKMGFGFGLRFVTPSMPIRLDWGYGLNHKTGDRRSQIYFSMANLF